MTALIVCTSVSHGNTKKVADVIGDVLEARVVDPRDIDIAEVADYDLVGFGSGIYYRKFHADLRNLVASLPPMQQNKAFGFATSGFSDAGMQRFSPPFLDSLEDKGFDVVGAFFCRALDTFGPFGLIGGHGKGRPNASDLDSARRFAEQLAAQMRG